MLRNVSSSDFQGLDHHRINFNFMRKIPAGAEANKRIYINFKLIRGLRGLVEVSFE